MDFDLLECQDPVVPEQSEGEKTQINTESLQDGDTEVTTVLNLKSHHELVYRKFA